MRIFRGLSGRVLPIACCVGLFLSAVSCAPKVKRMYFGGLTAAEVGSYIEANRRRINTFSASGNIESASGDRPFKADFALVWKKRVGVRMSLLSPFYTPVATMVFHEGKLVCLDHRADEKTEVSRRWIVDRMGVDIDPALLGELLAGSPELDGEKFQDVAPPEKTPPHYVWFRAKDADSSRYWKVAFDSIQGYIAIAHLCNNGSGESGTMELPVFVLRASEPIYDDKTVMPARIKLEQPVVGRSLTVHYNRLDINTEVDERVFTLP